MCIYTVFKQRWKTSICTHICICVWKFECDYINPEKAKKDIYSVINMGYLEWRISRTKCGKDGKPRKQKKKNQETDCMM